jgi:hypothetical protein
MKYQCRLDGKCTHSIKKTGMETSKEVETNGKVTLILGGELVMNRSEECQTCTKMDRAPSPAL